MHGAGSQHAVGMGAGRIVNRQGMRGRFAETTAIEETTDASDRLPEGKSRGQ